MVFLKLKSKSLTVRLKCGILFLNKKGMKPMNNFKVKENGIKTKFFVKNGRTMVHVSAYTREGNGKEYILPVEDMSSWYSLYFHLDYYYVSSQDDFILQADSTAPKYIKDKLNNKVYHLSNFYDPIKRQPVQEDNFIELDNKAMENKLSLLGMVTWNDNYTSSDIDRNARLISNTLNIIDKDLLDKQQKMQPQHNRVVDKNTYGFASDQELRTLTEMGVAFTMNNIMRRITDAKLGNLTTGLTDVE